MPLNSPGLLYLEALRGRAVVPTLSVQIIRAFSVSGLLGQSTSHARILKISPSFECTRHVDVPIDLS